MIITFCGHSNCLFSDDIKEQLKNILVSEIIKNPTCKFYLGGYGDFDGLCLRTLKELKNDFPEIELIFITPYLDKNYSKLEFSKYHYDDVVFPPLESVPRKFAILKRNEWMVDHSSRVIAAWTENRAEQKTQSFTHREKVWRFVTFWRFQNDY